ncbi:SRP-dependent cotranslational protein targeting to membrane protein [Malassezia pachydermatis]
MDAIHQRILQLTYISTLLDTVCDIFTKKYASLVRTLPTFSTSPDTLQSYANDVQLWEKEFVQLLRKLEQSPKSKKGTSTPTASPAAPKIEEATMTSPVSTPEPLKNAKAAAVGPHGRRVASGKAKKGKAAPRTEATPEPEGKKPTPGKERRKWGDNNEPLSDAALTTLDFSGAKNDEQDINLSQWIDERKMGTKRSDGVYELADDEAETNDNTPSFFGSLMGTGPTSFFSRLTGAKEALTKDDLAPVLHAMQMHLQSKNVANDVAALICEGVEKRLLGKRLGNFGSVKAEVRKSLEESITRILTPSTSTDILLEIASKKQRRAELLATLPAHAVKGHVSPALNPYAIGFVGVNGVGKSTNLAKVCFWLLQNRYRVLIAACDTFRSGAVEQLRTHVRNLGQLELDGHRVADGVPGTGEPMLELYERGYGKDAAGIAKDALAYARTSGFDVVLIDTAGRMQDNEPLMRALAKLIAVNQPDKVLFVGEALVGNEAVDQLTKFHRALKDYSGVADPRGLDGCLLTKWDTVDDKVGTALTSTWATGLPIYFVGTGQTYTDLRQLRVSHVVNALLRE